MDITCGIMTFNSRGEILVVHPSFSLKYILSIPKGLCDFSDTDYKSAAIREFYEETNIRLYPGYVKFIGQYKYPNRGKVLFGFYHTKVEDFDIKLMKCNSLTKAGFPEVDDYIWLNERNIGKIHITQQLLFNTIKSRI